MMDYPTRVSQRISQLYKSSQWHDLEFCLFNAKDGLPVVCFAHRLILAPCSQVLEAMCFGPLAEKTRIVVPDVEPQAFQAMLRYLYTDEVEFTSVELASHILYCAKKYLVSSLSTLAGQYLSKNVSDNNCIEIYNLAAGLDEEEICNAAFQHICRRFGFIKDYFCEENLNLNLLKNLVITKQLNCQEITLVVLAQMWAKNECKTSGISESCENIRNMLLQHNIFQNLQWHLLDVEDFTLLHPGLLSEEEISQRTQRQGLMARSPLPLRLSSVYMTPINEFIENSRRIQCHPGEGATMKTTIKVNNTVVLRSLTLIGKASPCSDATMISRSMETYSERLEVIIKRGDKVLLSQKFAESVGYETPFQLHLAGRVVFLQDVSYDIDIRILSDRNKSLFNYFTSNSIKNPQGLSVCCEKFLLKDYPNTTCLSFIAGFTFCY